MKEDCEAEDIDSDIDYDLHLKMIDKITVKRNQSAMNLCFDVCKNN